MMQRNKIMKLKRNVVAYVRVSTKKQSETSLDTKLEKIKKYVSGTDLKIVSIYL